MPNSSDVLKFFKCDSRIYLGTCMSLDRYLFNNLHFFHGNFWNWGSWSWWIVFVVWLTDKRRLALFPAKTIVRDPHHCKALTCQEPKSRLCWMKLRSSDNHYELFDEVTFSPKSILFKISAKPIFHLSLLKEEKLFILVINFVRYSFNMYLKSSLSRTSLNCTNFCS